MNLRNLIRAALVVLLCSSIFHLPAASRLRVASFRCDATPEAGEPLIWVTPTEKIEDPLWAKGIVIEGGKTRVVLCTIDWCGIGGATELLLRARVAEAASTAAERVALQSVHQHTAPYIDGDGYRVLATLHSPPLMMSAAFLGRLSDRMAAAVREAVQRLEPFDRIGTGEAAAEQVASARRIISEGRLVTRYSTSGSDPRFAALPEGDIDPMIRTVTLAAGEKPLVRLHYYATHPQTFCCDGRVSADFVGTAREAVEKEDETFQIYFTGCAGDVTVGKYNNQTVEARKAMEERLETAMKKSIAATKLHAVSSLHWRGLDFVLPLKTGAEFRPEALRHRLADSTGLSGQEQYRTAIALAFAERRRPLRASSLQLGKVWLLQLPGEPMLEFQKFALGLRPDAFVAVAGYGDISPGYLCTDRAFVEGGYEPSASNAGPGTEARVRDVIRRLLGR